MATPAYEIVERDEAGAITTSYIASATGAGAGSRLDVIVRELRHVVAISTSFSFSGFGTE
jgi:hypothetical protein